MTDKILPHHLNRKAILYVRQSSAFQVLHNLESQKLQYAMQTRLQQLGWPQVDVIDDDLGRSASGSDARSGFERMVAEVALGHVGVVAAREVSRFARNSRDWQNLVEVCRVVDTLLIDQETIYSPRDSNDRLLLGLKGSLNEYELDLLRQRSLEARRAKARRGELLVAAPVGFVKTEDQRLEKNPDRRVQEAVQLVFRKFGELGTIRQTWLWFLDEELQLPARRSGHETIWKRPRYAAVYEILTNPAYGGAYAYGKTEKVVDYAGGKPTRHHRRKAPERWLALIPEAHEGYIDWEQFQQNQRRIAANSYACGKAGAPRRGDALLAGLMRCRRCGRKLVVRYTGRGHEYLRYACRRGRLDQREPNCISFGGRTVDEGISREILRVVQPAAVEATRLAHEQAAQARDEVLEALQRDLEAAQYAASRAGKQYDAVDPENRLVAAGLERRWNQALERVQEVQQRINRHQAERDEAAVPGLEDLAGLADDLEALWGDGATDVRLKKRIVRALIEEVVADADAERGEVVLVIHWKGGVHTELRLPRRRRGCAQATGQDVIEAVRSLSRINPDHIIAGLLNRNGLRTGQGNRWTRMRVTSLRCRYGIPCYSEVRRQEEGWLSLAAAAAFLGVGSERLRRAAARGEIKGERPLAEGPWLFHRKDLETEAAACLVDRTRQREKRQGNARAGASRGQHRK